MIGKILRHNTSRARIAGFVISNFIGLAIVLGALQFYSDASSIWRDDKSFVSSDLLVINKRVTSAATVGERSTSISEAELSDLNGQPWVRSAAPFTASDFRVDASVRAGGRGLSTSMFFEAIPDSFVDVPTSQWAWRPGSDEVPIILPKDYLALYNFGFAGAAGLPQVSEGLMGSIPLTLTLTSEDGTRVWRKYGRIAGFSSRLNTILVPEAFMTEANAALGSGMRKAPSRVAVDTNSPGDSAIKTYLDGHGYEIAGDKSSSSAAFLLRVITGIIIAIGVLITLLSLFILLLSVSLIMERNRPKIHLLLMLGYKADVVARPFRLLALTATLISFVIALCAVFALRAYYLGPVESMGAVPGAPWLAPSAGTVLTLAIIAVNWVSVGRKVRGSFR